MLSNFLKPKQILYGINVKNKKSLFQELSLRSNLFNRFIDQKILFNKMIRREKLGNTSISNGVAMPSALLDEINETFVLFTILSKPIDYGAADKRPVDLVCLVVEPTKESVGLAKDYLYLAKQADVLQYMSIVANKIGNLYVK